VPQPPIRRFTVHDGHDLAEQARPGTADPGEGEIPPAPNRSTKDHHEQNTADPMCV
jgi:hypothetical protein